MKNDITVKTKCFIYLRRSQDRDDRQQLSIEKQDRRVRQIITDNEFTPFFLPPEERTARKPGRPIFDDMLNRIENGEARYIAVWHLSRLSRNSIDAGRLIYAIDTGKLLAIHTPGRVYRDTPDDKAFLAIELAFAKKNNDDLSEQVRDSFVDKRNHGEYPGPAPLGYVNIITSPGKRNIAPDPITSPKVIELFNKAASKRYTLDDIWREAQNIGLKSKRNKELGKQTVTELLKRRTYTGAFKYGGLEWHQGSYEPLISIELFDTVQLAMGWAKKRTTPGTTRGAFYPYKGLLLCKTCKFNVTAYTKPKTLADGTLKSYVFYTCTKKNKVVKCSEPQLSSKDLETEIKGRVSEYSITEADAEECLGYLKTFYSEHSKNRDGNRFTLLARKRDAQKALDTLDDKLEAGIISDERYQIRSNKHLENLARTKQLLGSSSQDAERWLELATETFTGAVDIGEVFEVATESERREIMKFLGLNWYLGNKKVALTPRKPLDALHISNRNLDWRARPDSNRRSPP
jgi:site-specific DNA recombinase